MNAVIVATPAGQVIASAALDERYRLGVVSLPHGFGDANVTCRRTGTMSTR